MVSNRCAIGISNFIDAVNPELSISQIDSMGKNLVITNCEGEFKKVYISNNLKHFDEGVRKTFEMIAAERPDAIREHAHIEFADNLVNIADAILTRKKLTSGEQEANRIVHAAVTTSDGHHLEPTCGRTDTNAGKLSDIMKFKENTTPEECVQMLLEITG